MTQHDLLKIAIGTFDGCVDLLNKKGKEYSGHDDALSHFKEAAKDLGLTELQVLSVFMRKHMRAVMSFVKEGKTESESIEERITDLINYLILMKALLHENK